jgi:hypothetical protein
MSDGIPDTIHTIPDALAFWAERTPDAPVFITPGEPNITYGPPARHCGERRDSSFLGMKRFAHGAVYSSRQGACGRDLTPGSTGTR